MRMGKGQIKVNMDWNFWGGLSRYACFGELKRTCRQRSSRGKVTYQQYYNDIYHRRDSYLHSVASSVADLGAVVHRGVGFAEAGRGVEYWLLSSAQETVDIIQKASWIWLGLHERSWSFNVVELEVSGWMWVCCEGEMVWKKRKKRKLLSRVRDLPRMSKSGCEVIHFEKSDDFKKKRVRYEFKADMAVVTWNSAGCQKRTNESKPKFLRK